jgi:hypothetical protein
VLLVDLGLDCKSPLILVVKYIVWFPGNGASPSNIKLVCPYELGTGPLGPIGKVVLPYGFVYDVGIEILKLG